MVVEVAGETRQGQEIVTETEIIEIENTSIEIENTAIGEGIQITNGRAREMLDLHPATDIFHKENAAAAHLVAVTGLQGAEIAAQVEGAEVSSGQV